MKRILKILKEIVVIRNIFISGCSFNVSLIAARLKKF